VHEGLWRFKELLYDLYDKPDHRSMRTRVTSRAYFTAVS
jgi:hypothetical protein